MAKPNGARDVGSKTIYHVGGSHLMFSRTASISVIFARLSLLSFLPVAALMYVRSALPETQPSQQTPTQQTQPADSSRSVPAQVPPPRAQASQDQSAPIEFESRGLEYEALTKNGITVMFAPLPPHIKDFNIVQVTVTNGSPVSWTVKPSDFTFIRQDGTELPTASADDVVESLLQKASRNDVIKLQLLYEDSIYALSNFRSTNGYEQRREAAMAQFVNRAFKAAAAASAITLVPVKLRSGESTDGAVFFANRTKDKTLGQGRLVAHTCGETFMFLNYSELKNR
jgi:hypothetical protein